MEDQEVLKDRFISIKDWAEDEKPREKLLIKGPLALTDAELLAILIGSGTAKRTALDLARETIGLAHNSLHELGKLGVKELQKTKGIGEARAITIAAALEIGRRRQLEEALQRTVITSSKDAAAIAIPLLRDHNQEVFCVMYLNQAHKLIHYELISSGGLSSVVVDVRMIFKNALLSNASNLILAHNHPSGNLEPSTADKKLTTKIMECGQLMDINLVDHIIVGESNFLSMQDRGHINK